MQLIMCEVCQVLLVLNTLRNSTIRHIFISNQILSRYFSFPCYGDVIVVELTVLVRLGVGGVIVVLGVGVGQTDEKFTQK